MERYHLGVRDASADAGCERQLRLLDNNTAQYRKQLPAAEERTRRGVVVG
jgi:hypothetical protein